MRGTSEACCCFLQTSERRTIHSSSMLTTSEPRGHLRKRVFHSSERVERAASVDILNLRRVSDEVLDCSFGDRLT